MSLKDIRAILDGKRAQAEAACPEGMELIGWKIFGEDRFATYPLYDPLSRPLYAFKEEQ